MESIMVRLNDYDANVLLADVMARLRFSALAHKLDKASAPDPDSVTADIVELLRPFTLGRPLALASDDPLPFYVAATFLPPRLVSHPGASSTARVQVSLDFDNGLVETSFSSPVYPLSGSLSVSASALEVVLLPVEEDVKPFLRLVHPQTTLELTERAKDVTYAEDYRLFDILTLVEEEISRQIFGVHPAPPTFDISLPNETPFAPDACSLSLEKQSPLLFHATQAMAGARADFSDELSGALEIRLDSLCGEEPDGTSEPQPAEERLSSLFVPHEFVQSLVCWALGSLAEPPGGIPGGAGSAFERPGRLAPRETLDITAFAASAAKGSNSGPDVEGAIELIDLLDALEQAAGPDLWPVGAPDGPPDYTAVPPQWVPALDTLVFGKAGDEHTLWLQWWPSSYLEASLQFVEELMEQWPGGEEPLEALAEMLQQLLGILEQLGMASDIPWGELAPDLRTRVVSWLLTGAGAIPPQSALPLASWFGSHECLSLRQLVAWARVVAEEAEDPTVTPLRTLAALFTPYLRKKLRSDGGSDAPYEVDRVEIYDFEVAPDAEQERYVILARLEADLRAYGVKVTLERVTLLLSVRFSDIPPASDVEPACWRPVELDVELLHLGGVNLPWWVDLLFALSGAIFGYAALKSWLRNSLVMPGLEKVGDELVDSLDRLLGGADVQDLRYDLLPAIRDFRFGDSGLEVVTRLTELASTHLGEGLLEDLLEHLVKELATSNAESRAEDSPESRTEDPRDVDLLRSSVRVASTGTRLLGRNQNELDLDAECIERGLPEAPDLTWRPGSEGPVVEFARSGAMDVLLA
ncbi:MAG: hypothetical protein ACQEXJ_24865, partial [Myxococcota bacterium]